MRKKKNDLDLHPTALCVFEDDHADHFEPLHFLHPVWELSAGIFPLYAKISHEYDTLDLVLSCREDLAPAVTIPDGARLNVFAPGDYLMINGRVSRPHVLAKYLQSDGPEMMYLSGDTIVAARIKLSTEHTGSIWEMLDERRSQLPHHEIDIPVYGYLWDIVHDNGRAIAEDAKEVPLGKSHASLYPTTLLLNPKLIYTGERSIIGPGVVLDASQGPVIIDDDVEIMANSVIQGPVFIGEKSVIKANASIYGGTTIGHTCKIGGEVAETLILPYTNKQHHGFIGHSYIGSWCNLGAGTTNSDLKNTYGEVSIQLGKKTVETGKLFAGLFMGDHVKSGINSTFSTGTVVGPVSNVVTSGISPRYLPPFSWIADEKGRQSYDVEKACIVAERMMQRRGKQFTETDREIFGRLSSMK